MSRFWMYTAVVAAASLGGAVSAASAADGSTPMVVNGTQTVVDETKGRYAMAGDLLGSWNVTAFTPHYQGPDGLIVASGKELFNGCRDADRSGACEASEPAGTIRFSFVYWATFNPKTQALVRGRCVHPVLGGTGAFAGIKGVLHMNDVPTKNGVHTTYTGTLLAQVSVYRPHHVSPPAVSTSSLATRELAGRVAHGACGG
jgi:hypothetical protein